jgi:hypothetical protein
MSVTIRAYAVIGYKIPRSALTKLIKYTNVKACKHPNQEGKFCSECGVLTWKSVPDYGSVYDLLEALAIPFEEDCDDFYIGMIATQGQYATPGQNFKEIDLAAIKVTADNNLAKLKIKPEELQFGLWAVLYYN